MDYEQKHQEDLEAAKGWLAIAKENNNKIAIQILENLFPELKESEDEKWRNWLIGHLKGYINQTDNKYAEVCKKAISWLEKQGEQKSANFDEAEKEKTDFVSGQFIECRKSFNEFKEFESYWFEYVGDDTYIGRSDNILNQRFHITPRQLFTLFTHQHCPKDNEKQGENSVCKVKIGETYKCIASPRYTCFRTGDIYYVEDNFVAELINTCSDCFVLLEKQGEQKPADTIEPKFHEGDWVVSPNGVYWHIDKISNSRYEVTSDTGESSNWPLDTNIYHKFNIQDAKNGDIIVNDFAGGTCIAIFKSFTNDKTNINIYCHLANNDFCPKYGTSNATWHPTTKEQRDFLFQKMKEAGYEWDTEKKELKKIEQKPDWSEEDELMLEEVCNNVEFAIIKRPTLSKELGEKQLNWLKSLKDRLQPQPKQEWNEEDEERIRQICGDLRCAIINFEAGKNVKGIHFTKIIESNIDWLKSLKDRVQSQPKQEWSEHQHKLLNYAISMTDDTEVKNFLESLRNHPIHKQEWGDEDESKLTDALLLIQNADDCSGILPKEDVIDWLKSIKNRVHSQQKQEWSEFDNDMMNAIICLTKQGRHLEEEHINWIKSIKPNNWKPTEEQMYQLGNVIDGEKDYDINELTVLYQQLQKL